MRSQQARRVVPLRIGAAGSVIHDVPIGSVVGISRAPRIGIRRSRGHPAVPKAMSKLRVVREELKLLLDRGNLAWSASAVQSMYVRPCDVSHIEIDTTLDTDRSTEGGSRPTGAGGDRVPFSLGAPESSDTVGSV